MVRGMLLGVDGGGTSTTAWLAGPGGEGDEEGLVHFGCARRDGTNCHREEHFGAIGRAGVRIAALEVALSMVDEALDNAR